MSSADMLAPTMIYPSYVDGARLQRVTQGRVDIQLRLLDFFIQGMTHSLWEAEQAIQDRNGSDLYFRGHQIKGSAANCGLTQIAELAQQLEQTAQGEDFEQALLLLALLRNQLTDLAAFVTHWQQQPHG